MDTAKKNKEKYKTILEMAKTNKELVTKPTSGPGFVENYIDWFVRIVSVASLKMSILVQLVSQLSERRDQYD